MRHQRSGRKLGRTRSHRKATLSSLSTSLITHKRIKTTLAKAKEARIVVEKLVTRAKRAVAAEGNTDHKNVHARRQAFSFLRDRDAVSALFNDIAPKVAGRPGGYTRIVKLGQRQGDGAHVAMLEFVDFGPGEGKPAPKEAKKKTPASKKKTEGGEAKQAKAETTTKRKTKTRKKESSASTDADKGAK